MRLDWRWMIDARRLGRPNPPRSAGEHTVRERVFKDVSWIDRPMELKVS